jgi:hypothetical protein
MDDPEELFACALFSFGLLLWSTRCQRFSLFLLWPQRWATSDRVGADWVVAGNSGITPFDPVTSLSVSYTSQTSKEEVEKSTTY